MLHGRGVGFSRWHELASLPCEDTSVLKSIALMSLIM